MMAIIYLGFVEQFHASEAATHLVFDLYRDIVGPVRQFLNDMVRL